MSAIALPEFASGLAAACVDESLRQALAACDRARECAVLWFAEVQRWALYCELGYPSLELYATQGLGFSRNRYFQFKSLADGLERLPRLRAAVARGEIGWTKAQQVARVATPASEPDWIEKATSFGRRELAAEVKKVKAAAKLRRQAASGQMALVAPVEPAASAAFAADPPTTVSFRLDGIQLARYEAAVERIRELGLVPREAGREEILLAALELLAEGGELRRRNSRNIKPPIQIVIRKCPACERAAVVTSQGEKRVASAQLASAECDAVVSGENGRNRATIKPSVRAAVLARDRHRCTTPGCNATHFLEVHHVIPREAGGSNQAENLVTLCSRCHRFQHEHAPG